MALWVTIGDADGVCVSLDTSPSAQMDWCHFFANGANDENSHYFLLFCQNGYEYNRYIF
jgi:hypothetical protein